MTKRNGIGMGGLTVIDPDEEHALQIRLPAKIQHFLMFEAVMPVSTAQILGIWQRYGTDVTMRCLQQSQHAETAKRYRPNALRCR